MNSTGPQHHDDQTAAAGPQPQPEVTTQPQSSIRQFLTALAVGGVAVAALVGLGLSDSGKVLVEPGPVRQVVYPLTGDQTSDDSTMRGERWLMTTIRVSGLNWFEATIRELTGSRDLRDGSLTAPTSGNIEMFAAKRNAAFVAATLLGTGGAGVHVVVVGVDADSAAERAGLREGDVVAAVDGVEVRDTDDAAQRIDATTATLTLIRDGKTVRVDLPARSAGGLLGIRLMDVALAGGIDGDKIDSGDVGGASAGLIFTLATLDAFDRGDLSSGLKVAGTGTIRTDGSVGAIIGAAYKYRAAVKAGAEVFFVPARNAVEIEQVDSTVVVAVDDVSDALRWLCDNGSDSSLCTQNTRTSLRR